MALQEIQTVGGLRQVWPIALGLQPGKNYIVKGSTPDRSRQTATPTTTLVALAFVLIYITFDQLATAIGSTRGESGVLICVVVVALCVGVETVLTRARVTVTLRKLGLRRAASRPLLASAAIAVGLLATLPLLAQLTGATLTLRDGAAALAFGMFWQGGVAEETLFRGFMYRHLRATRTFWRAATLSAVPFAAAHLPLFWSLEAGVALLALGMAIAWSFPLAWVFDRAGGSIWPGALLHATIQGGIKVLVDDGPAFQSLAMTWVALGLAAPWLLFALRDGAAAPHERPAER